MKSHQLINQTSGATEFWTPQPIIEAARLTMGGIDLDPASTAEANLRVKARYFYTKKDNGLEKDWFGSVWLNHPFHAGWTACTQDCKRKSCEKRGHHIYEDIPGNEEWITKLVQSYAAKMEQACCITFAATSEAWFKPLLDFPQCFLTPRTNYLLPNGKVFKGVPKGSVVTYLGTNLAAFAKSFRSLGVIKVRFD